LGELALGGGDCGGIEIERIGRKHQVGLVRGEKFQHRGLHRSPSPPRRRSGVRPVSDSNRSARFSSVKIQPSADSAIASASRCGAAFL